MMVGTLLNKCRHTPTLIPMAVLRLHREENFYQESQNLLTFDQTEISLPPMIFRGREIVDGARKG